VHEAVAIWNAAVAHEDHNLMDGLWVLGEVVPEGCGVVGVSEVGGWIAFLSVGTSLDLSRRKHVG
jgi:hypothetical protein